MSKRKPIKLSTFDGDLPPSQDAKNLAAKYSDQANARFDKISERVAASKAAAGK